MRPTLRSIRLIAFFLLFIGSAAELSAQKVAMLAAESNASWRNDVKDKLLGTGLISEVDVINVNATTPTLATLQQYAAVMIWSDSSFDNRTEMGNVLADYVDQGGGVVQATFSFYSDGFSLGLGGRWVTDAGYRTLTQANQSQGTVLTLVADEPAHAILSGVNSFNGGSNSYHNASSLTSGSTLIAHWSNNRPLVAVRTGPSAGKIVGLNMFPPSSDERADLWDASTDGALLMANSLSWVAGVAVSDQPPTLTVTDRSVDEGRLKANRSSHREHNTRPIDQVPVGDTTINKFDSLDPRQLPIEPRNTAGVTIRHVHQLRGVLFHK